MKKNIRALLCLVLALTMALSLAACGKTGEATPESKDSKDSKDSEATVTDYAYKAEFTPVESPEDSHYNPCAFTADGIYATSYEKVGERELFEGETLEYEGQLDVYGPSLFFISNDGKVKKLEGFQPLPAPEDGENRTNYSSGSDLMVVGLNDSGELTAIEAVYQNWFDGSPEELYADQNWDKWHYERSYYIRTLSADGSEISSAPIAFDLGDDSYVSFSSLCRDSKGNYLATYDTTLIAFAPDGSISYVIESEDSLNNVVRLKDGTACVTVWGNAGMELRTIDAENGVLGEKIPLPANAYDLLPGGGDYDLCYRNGSFLYGIRLESGETEKILNWINCDINGDYMNGMNIAEDGTITGVLSYYRGDANRTEFVTLSKVPADTLPHKETLSLAVMYLDYDMSDKIIDFNRRSDKVRIELRDYSEYNTEEDYSAGLTKLTTEILSGKMPDLLSLNGLPYSQLAAKGLLEDLYPYLDADEELDREDLFPTVLKAMEANGGLYRLCPSFAVQSLIGAASVVGDKPGWNYEQFREALASMPEGCTPLDQYTTRDNVLNTLVSLDMNDFVDWNTGSCSFDSEEFVEVLTFANSFQAEFDWENYEWTEDESTPTRIAQGKQMLMQAGIYSIDDVIYNDVYFGGDSTYIGWPTNNGVGNMLYLGDHAYAMSASCSDKEAGWEFLRSLLAEDYQSNLYGLPVVQKVFDAKLKEAMTVEYQKDAEGNYVLDENGEKIQVSRGGVGFGDGSTYEIYALSQEQADKLLEVINTTEKVMDQNDAIFSIVQEQAAAYFAGQKDPEEVARLVQSKAKLYVNEQR